MQSNQTNINEHLIPGEFLLKEIVENIKEAADELIQIDGKKLLDQGQLIAYAECLCIIRDSLAGYDLSHIGLDFDIDTKYLA